MQLQYYFFVFLMALCHTILGQSIRGIVQSTTGEGIPFATVSVLNTNLGTTADKDGQFSLNLGSGDYQIAVNALGYATKIWPVTANSQTAKLAFTLEKSIETLGEVVVTANKREEDILKVATSITSLSAQKSYKYHENGLREAQV